MRAAAGCRSTSRRAATRSRTTKYLPKQQAQEPCTGARAPPPAAMPAQTVPSSLWKLQLSPADLAPVQWKKHCPTFVRPVQAGRQRLFQIGAAFNHHAIQDTHPMPQQSLFHTQPERPAARQAAGSALAVGPGALPARRNFAPFARPLNERSACSNTSSWAATGALARLRYRARSSWACLRWVSSLCDRLSAASEAFLLPVFGLLRPAAAAEPVSQAGL